MVDILFELVVILLLTTVNGILAMAELAVVSARKGRLRSDAEKGSKGAAAALDLAGEQTSFLSTVQIGITLIGIGTGVYGGRSFVVTLSELIAPLPLFGAYAVQISFLAVVIGITFLSLVFGELVPKRLALAYPELLAELFAPPLKLFGRLIRPVVRLLDWSTEMAVRLLRLNPAEGGSVSEEDIMTMVQEGTESGALFKSEGSIVSKALQLDLLSVASAMTPRTQVLWLDLREPLAAQFPELAASTVDTFPAAEGDLDSVKGVVSLKDLFEAQFAGADIAARVRPALIVPSSIPLLRVLQRLQDTSNDFALVIDEHGGVDGVVTLHDIFEALVGDLREGEETSSVIRRDDGSLLVDSSANVNDVFERLELDYERDPRGVFHSLGGFVFSTFGRVPRAGESFEHQGYRFEVVDMDGQRIDKVLITRLAPQM